MDSDTTKVAFYKARPSCSIKHRPGPVQCVRNCTNCILNREENEDLDVENILLLTSYDNLVQRKRLWFSKYHSIQYHVGQIAILKDSLNKKSDKQRLTLYVVAATRFADLDYLNMVLDYEQLPALNLFQEAPSNSWESLRLKKNLAIMFEIKSCPVDEKFSIEDKQILHVMGVRDFLQPIVQSFAEDSIDSDVSLVPVVITKDHDKRFSLRDGSVCVQILEPYSLQDYLANIRTKYATGHLVQHLYYDLSRNAARMPAHIVAFLVLYLNRDEGVTIDDLIDLLDWFKRSSMDLGLQFAFTGETRDVIEYALLTLKDLIHYNQDNGVYIPINLAGLVEYANLVVPNIAYQGIIARAILTLHNKDEKNKLLTNLCPTNEPIRVEKEELEMLSCDMAERIDHLLPCRKPCVTVEMLIEETIHQMGTFYHYFKVEEPKVKQPRGPSWLHEFDTPYDENYYASRQDDPAFKSWVVLTQRPYRLDRLNLFLNAINSILY